MAAPIVDTEASLDWSLSELAPISRKMFDDMLTPRPKVNWERTQTLQEDPEFLARLEMIRQREKISKNLKFETDVRADIVSYGDGEMEIVESYFLDYEIGKLRRKRIQNEIASILKDYSLPLNFHDWIQCLLLYRKPLNGTPRYNWDLLDQVMSDPDEAKRIPLSSAEKKFWLWAFRFSRGIRPGRIPKKYAPEYKKLKDIFADSKNTLRRSRRIADTLDLIDFQKKAINAKRKGGGKKLTYRDAVAELTQLETEPDFKREASKLRQRKSRYLKRLETLKKPRK